MALIVFHSHRYSNHKLNSSCLPYCKELVYSDELICSQSYICCAQWQSSVHLLQWHRRKNHRGFLLLKNKPCQKKLSSNFKYFILCLYIYCKCINPSWKQLQILIAVRTFSLASVSLFLLAICLRHPSTEGLGFLQSSIYGQGHKKLTQNPSVICKSWYASLAILIFPQCDFVSEIFVFTA